MGQFGQLRAEAAADWGGGGRPWELEGGGQSEKWDLRAPRGRYFTKTHEWLEVEHDDAGNAIATVGITQVAQQALGEVVYCRVPRVGQHVRLMETIATLEALKTVAR